MLFPMENIAHDAGGIPVQILHTVLTWPFRSNILVVHTKVRSCIRNLTRNILLLLYIVPCSKLLYKSEITAGKKKIKKMGNSKRVKHISKQDIHSAILILKHNF